MDCSLFYSVDPTMYPIPLSRLHLGGAEQRLAGEGVTTLGELLSKIELVPSYLNKVRRLSHEDILCIRNRLNTVSMTLDGIGLIDWDKFDELSEVQSTHTDSAPTTPDHLAEQKAIQDGLRLLPSVTIQSGGQFIDSLPDVLAGLMRARHSPVDDLILEQRILRLPGERLTLEVIASASLPALTRERVRQREAKLLEHLSSLFLGQTAKGVGARIRPSFSLYWQKAAEQLSHSSQLTIYSFVESLSSAWNVDPAEILANLPLILAVLTSKATLPADLRTQINEGPEVFSPIPSSIQGLSLAEFPCGITTGQLAALSLGTADDLWRSLRTGQAPPPTTPIGKGLRNLARALSSASLSNEIGIDWSVYQASMDMDCLPEDDPSDASCFLSNLPEWVERIVERMKLSANSLEIYRARISVARTSRPTLLMLAQTLGTHGPSIKREESIMLRAMNELLVQRELCSSDVCIGRSFLSFWTKAASFFAKSDGDYAAFVRSASISWGVSRDSRPESFEVLWAILSQYPGGRVRRPSSRGDAKQMSMNSDTSGTITLRGFHRLH